MKNLLKNKNTRTDLLTYLLVIVAFAVMQGMNSAGLLGSSVKGFLIPICVYISLAVSLNLLVGICGELSLGHAGFMGIGAFTGDGLNPAVMSSACAAIKACGGAGVPTVKPWNMETIEAKMEKVKASGVEYAILRLGYRGMNEGTLELDPYYKENIKKATAAGVKVGIYFFSQAKNTEEAVEEAEFVLENIKGYEIAYPVVFDTEEVTTYDARANGLTRAERTDCCIAFCEKIKEAGYTPMIYANTRYMVMGLELERLNDYDKWFAYYGTSHTFPYAFTMLQYSDTGRVPGIEGAVDLDVSFVDYAAPVHEE